MFYHSLIPACKAAGAVVALAGLNWKVLPIYGTLSTLPCCRYSYLMRKGANDRKNKPNTSRSVYYTFGYSYTLSCVILTHMDRTSKQSQNPIIPNKLLADVLQTYYEVYHDFIR